MEPRGVFDYSIEDIPENVLGFVSVTYFCRGHTNNLATLITSGPGFSVVQAPDVIVQNQQVDLNGSLIPLTTP